MCRTLSGQFLLSALQDVFPSSSDYCCFCGDVKCQSYWCTFEDNWSFFGASVDGLFFVQLLKFYCLVCLSSLEIYVLFESVA